VHLKVGSAREPAVAFEVVKHPGIYVRHPLPDRSLVGRPESEWSNSLTLRFRGKLRGDPWTGAGATIGKDESLTEQTKAVFLSYASQDAEAAQRICDALRTA